MGYKIEAYIHLKNLNKLDELREKNKEAGYSKVIDEILTRHFFGDIDRERALLGLNKVIEGLNGEIQNLKYELRYKGKKKPKKPKQNDDMNTGE